MKQTVPISLPANQLILGSTWLGVGVRVGMPLVSVDTDKTRPLSIDTGW